MVARYISGWGETYFEKEINAKTRIMIPSQYPKNRKNEILNP